MAVATTSGIEHITDLLGDEASSLLRHRCHTVDKSLLHLPGPDSLDRVFVPSDRNKQSMADGVALLHAIQDVYLCPEVTVA